MVTGARVLVRDRAAAEDLAQESFLAAHRSWEKVSGYDAPRPGCGECRSTGPPPDAVGSEWS